MARPAAVAPELPIRISEDSLRDFCERHHVVRFAFFGSVLRSDFGPKSDLDILVEFDREHVPGFFALAGMEAELTELLGRRVDLQTAAGLSPLFRDEVLAEARVEHVAAPGT
jgi:uncharacterized protein